MRLLTGGSGSLIHTESSDAAGQCAEFIRRAYQMKIGSLAGISIDWSAVEAALRRTMNDAAREALDYACDYAVTNAETAVDNGLGTLSRAAAKLSGGTVTVSASRSGIRVSDPTDKVIARLRNGLDAALPRVKRGTPDLF